MLACTLVTLRKKDFKNLGECGFRLFLHSQIKRGTEKYKGDSVAQLVEQYTFNVWVLGSSPNGITKGREAQASFFIGEKY